ncbi:histone deacetylase family protein [Nitzschia inconspicua]|uniref:Histone deacetylase family protein n=1 Tax=Nitzschia inconspicua TaxID=303405 RepID=A0A9K3KX31_9STRA|nr:histone deacetylase family protein [Nitzschia inconspicua]
MCRRLSTALSRTISGRYSRRTFPHLGSKRTLSVQASLPNVDETTERETHNYYKNATLHPPRAFQVFYNDVYEVPLPPNHRFPMNKYRLVRERIQKLILSQQLIPNNSIGIPNFRPNIEFVVSPLATVEELLTTHDASYIERFLCGNQTQAEQRNVGFPWSPQGVDRALSSVGGTLAAARFVCDHQQQLLQNESSTQQQSTASSAPAWAAHVAGGTHHAFYDYGEGFSVFSDMAVASNVILQEYSHIRNILLLDLDVHQGNGNAVLFQKQPRVFTFSMHCSGNYFSPKQQSDWDIELPIGCNDSTYLMTLHHWLKEFKKRHQCGDFSIDLILFQAGVDILETDRLGRMNLTSEGVRRRNEMVYQFVDSLQVPLVICMGGGYPKRTKSDEEDGWEEIIDAHATVYLQAYEFLANHETGQVA